MIGWYYGVRSLKRCRVCRAAVQHLWFFLGGVEIRLVTCSVCD